MGKEIRKPKAILPLVHRRSRKAGGSLVPNDLEIGKGSPAAKNDLHFKTRISGDQGTIILKASSKPENKMSHIEKIDLIDRGLTKKNLEFLKHHADWDYDQLANVLNVARSSLINKKPKQTYNGDLSEKILEIAALYSYGYEVFEDKESFNQWIFKKNKALGGRTPFELLRRQPGREEVRNLIGRVDYGVYS
ncbi:MAG: hypothetical protein NVS1B13_20280 [Flavisolibacter sp.]